LPGPSRQTSESATTHRRAAQLLAAAIAAALALAAPLAPPLPAAAADDAEEASGRAAGPVRSLLEMRRERVVAQDFDLSCGAAALATLLTHQLGDPVSEREVTLGLLGGRREYLDDPGLLRVRQGFSLLDLKRYVERRGHRGVGLGNLTLADLVARAPVMVPVDLTGYDHFVVFRGLAGGRVFLADPAWGNRAMPVERFEAAWIGYPGFGRVGLVVARADGGPPSNRLAPRPGEDFTVPGAVLREALAAAAAAP
jgi:hypothetical protein